jgi:hypothetical protein
VALARDQPTSAEVLLGPVLQFAHGGDIKSLKLQAALRLARELHISPWYLGGELEPTKQRSANGTAKERDQSMASLHLSPPGQPETAEHERIMQEVARLRARVSRLERALKKSNIP